MIIDAILILVFVMSLWIGWSIRIYIDWRRMVWLIIFGLVIRMVLPYFVNFVEQSSANLTVAFYYTFAIGMATLIFLCFYMLFRGKDQASGVRRIAGSIVLAIVSFYSLVIVLWTMGSYRWIDVGHSMFFSHFPEWFLKPFD